MGKFGPLPWFEHIDTNPSITNSQNLFPFKIKSSNLKMTMKHINSIKAITAIFSFFLGLLGSEAVYRVMLHSETIVNIDTLKKKHNDDSIRFFSYPFQLLFREDYGFDYFTGDVTFGSIDNGTFINCQTTRKTDWSADAINPDHETFNEGDLRILLLGSSYTASLDENGDLATTIAAQNLSKRLKRRVKIQNLSRGSTGILEMMDLASVKIPQYRPDLVLITLNTQDITRPRWWPILKSDGNGFFRYYQSRIPAPKSLTRFNAVLHEFVIYEKVTREWCSDMMEAKKVGESRRLIHDPILLAMIEQGTRLGSLRSNPQLDADLGSLATSYLYNKIAYGSPYYDIELYKNNNPIAPIQIDSFREDAAFMSAWEKVRESGIPVYIVHVPAYPEIRDNIEFAHGKFSVPPKRERKLTESLQEIYGRPLLSLLSYMHTPRSDASELIVPSKNWHPNSAGTRLLGIAFEEAIMEILGEIRNTQ